MPVPPEPVLRAALRWLEHLPPSGAARSRALFVTHHEFSDLTPTQYDAAYAWLRDIGILHARETRTPAHIAVFDAAVRDSAAAWLPDADLLLRTPDELPHDILRTAQALGLTHAEAFARIGAIWRKVDTTERERVGIAGEHALLGLLAQSTTAAIEHVAAWSDGHGYDIAVTAEGFAAHLEVKSTLRRGRLTVFLSRHEYETMTRDPHWHMIVIRLNPDLTPAAVASMPSDWITGHVPNDRAGSGRWETCRLEIPPAIPRAGMTLLTPVLHGTPASLLSARAIWPG